MFFAAVEEHDLDIYDAKIHQATLIYVTINTHIQQLCVNYAHITTHVEYI
jgi:hypothetical protein